MGDTSGVRVEGICVAVEAIVGLISLGCVAADSSFEQELSSEKVRSKKLISNKYGLLGIYF